MKNSFILKILFLAGYFVAGSTFALEPIPSFYQEPGFAPNRDYVNQSPNEHIDPFTGKLQLHYTDLHIPGNGGLDINIQRSYNSQNELLTEPSAVGVGWTMHYGRVLRRSTIAICTTNTDATKAPVLELPDGSRQILYLVPDWTYVMSISRWKGVCAPGGLGLDIYSPDGTVYEMRTPGIPVGEDSTRLQASYYTTRIVDRKGNTLNFTYVSAENKTSISQITSSDGRTVTFSYTANVLSQITDGTSVWKYEYDTSDPYTGATFPFLTKVTRPDNTTWEYVYSMTPPSSTSPAGSYSLKQLKYPTNGVVNYTYGFVQFNSALPKSTVVSQKVGFSGTWTYSYNPATEFMSCAAGFCTASKESMVDRTYVNGPDGSHLYAHIGANSVGPGLVYAIGLLLMRSSDGGYENEYRYYTAQKISNIYNMRPGAPLLYDTATYAAMPSQVRIQRNGQDYVTTYSNFDQYGNAQKIDETGTDTRSTTVAYESFAGKWILHLPKSQTVDTIGTTSWQYDPTNANLLAETKYGVKTEFTYTPQGDLFTKKDARGNVTTYNDYYRGIPRVENHPEEVNISRAVSTQGNVLQETDGENSTVKFTYDLLNRLISITHPVGNPVSIVWQPLKRIVTRGGYTETTNFDNYGRATTVTLSGGGGGPITQTYAYDPLGRKIFSSYPNQAVGTYSKYDILGRPFAVYHVAQPNGSYTGGKRTSYFNGNKVVNTNERAYPTELTYRGYGNPDALDLMQVAAPEAAASVSMTRNGLGQILSVMQGGINRQNTYDSHYFPYTTINPEIGTTLYGTDEVGNITSKTVGSSTATTYIYDGLNRLRTINYPVGTTSVTKDYYKDNTLKLLNNGVTQRTFTYTPNKKLKHEDLAVDGKSFAVDYTYSDNDALNSVTYSTGLTLSYAPDALGWPTQAMPFATKVGFYPNGLPEQIVYGNGVTTAFTLNARQWPANALVSKSGSPTVINMTYLYDDTGNVTTVTDAASSAQNRTFGYDKIDRLTNVTMPGVLGGLITYDGAGNIKSKQYGTFALNYNFDASNKLATVTGSRSMTFNYDAYGNVTGNSKNLFTYDDASLLKCVDCGTAGEINYVYDGAGTRVMQKTPTQTTYFMYGSSGDLMFDVDSSGTKREYGYVAGRNIAKKESH